MLSGISRRLTPDEWADLAAFDPDTDRPLEPLPRPLPHELSEA